MACRGLIGPDRQIGPKTLYHPVAYWALIGVFLPLPFYFLTRRWPNSRLKYVNIPVMLVAPSFAPPATGINFSAWILVSFIFQFYLRRNRFRWWSKYNFVLSAALDSGTVIATVVIFFALSLPKDGTIQLNWWGNTVWQKSVLSPSWSGNASREFDLRSDSTADYQGLPYKTPPEEGFGPTEWH